VATILPPNSWGMHPWTGETHRNVTSAKVASTRHLVFLGIDSHGFTVERIHPAFPRPCVFFCTWKVALKNGKRSIDLTILHVFVFCTSFWKNCFDLQVENKNWHAKVHVRITVRSPVDMVKYGKYPIIFMGFSTIQTVVGLGIYLFPVC